MRWFVGCSDKKYIDTRNFEQSINAFVSSKHVSSDSPIILFVEVYQNKGWSHRSLLVSSSLRVEWVDTNKEELSTGTKTLYQYHLWGDDGGHIIEPISLHGVRGDQQDLQKTHEIFVDVGGKKQETNLRGISRREDASFPWYWVVTGLGGEYSYRAKKGRKSEQSTCHYCCVAIWMHDLTPISNVQRHVKLAT